MKILIVNNLAPYTWGGAEELAVNLQKNIILQGHQAEILRIPFQWEPPTVIPSQMLMVKGFELENVDKVIALKFPAYLIRHPHKILWLLHQYRQAYDLYETPYSNLVFNENGQNIRELIKNADNECFKECKKIFTNSKVTQSRLTHYNNFNAEVLLPPVNDPDLFTGGISQGYIFAGGRVSGMKRQHLLIKAMKYSDPKVKLIIAGPPDSPEDGLYLKKLVESLNLQQRIKLDLRFLPRKELASYVNGALACAYLPFDEDSLGYVSMEAALAAKALITTSDSGGIRELVYDHITGWVCDPEAEKLAEAMDSATLNPEQTRKYGLVLQEFWLKKNLNWPHTIARLLA